MLLTRTARREGRSAGRVKVRVKSEPPAVAGGSRQYPSRLKKQFNHQLWQVVLTRRCGNTIQRYSLRSQKLVEASGFHRDCRNYSCAWHRREHGDIHRAQCGDAARAAGEGSAAACLSLKSCPTRGERRTSDRKQILIRLP